MAHNMASGGWVEVLVLWWIRLFHVMLIAWFYKLVVKFPKYAPLVNGLSGVLSPKRFIMAHTSLRFIFLFSLLACKLFTERWTNARRADTLWEKMTMNRTL